MTGNRKAKLLILSISLLILMTILYSYEKSNGTLADGEEKEGGTVATVVKETSIKAYNYTAEKIEIFIERQKIKKAERKAEKERKKAEAEKEKNDRKDNILSDKYYFGELITTGDEYEFIEYEETNEEQPPQFVLYKSEDGNRYVKRLGYYIPGETAEYRYIPVRTEIDGVAFAEHEDTVYAGDNIPIYGNPKYMGEPLYYASINTAFTRIGISKNSCYQLVTAEGQIVYGEGKNFTRLIEPTVVTEAVSAPSDKALLDVKYVPQNPTLPTGCEVTALTTVLNYYGIDVTKETLADKYLPKAPIGRADFHVEFVGNPRSAGSYGCYAPAIVKTAEAFFEAESIDLKVNDYTGSTFSHLLEQVYNGKPVIVWATSPMDDEPVFTTQWNIDGDVIKWKGNLHCLVLIGYDMQAHTITTADPLHGIKEYDMDLFVKRFKQMYSQAVIIER